MRKVTSIISGIGATVGSEVLFLLYFKYKQLFNVTNKIYLVFGPYYVQQMLIRPSFELTCNLRMILAMSRTVSVGTLGATAFRYLHSSRC